MARLFVIALIVAGLDQASKYLVLYGIDLATLGRIEVIPATLNFQLAWNRGINFGLLDSSSELMRFVWISVAVIIVFGLLWHAYRSTREWHEILAIGLITGGALGNTMDRLLMGAVIDFLNVTCCGINNPYSFNVADTAIFTGAAIMILSVFR